MSNTDYQYSPDHEGTWREIKELLAPLPPETVRSEIESAVNGYIALRIGWELIPRGNEGRERINAVRAAAKRLDQTVAALDDWERGVLTDACGAGNHGPLPTTTAIIQAIDEYLFNAKPDKGGGRVNYPFQKLVESLFYLCRYIDFEPEAGGYFLKLVDDCLILAGEEGTTEPKSVQRILSKIRLASRT